MITRARIVLTRGAALLWVVAGIILPLSIVLDLTSRATIDALWPAAGCVVLAALFSQVRFEFSRKEHSLELSLDAAFVVLAAILLTPALTAVVGAVGGFFASSGDRGERRLFRTASQALAAGVAAHAVEAFVSASPHGKFVLPAAVLAAVVGNGLALTGTLLAEEALEPGGALELARSTPLLGIFVLNASVPVAACAMAGPFLVPSWQAFLVVTGAQGLAWAALRLLRDEHRQRIQNDYLRDTVSRYMPLSVAEQMLEHSTEHELGGDQREITVMFCDVRGFTSWAEQNQPDDVIAELNRLLTHLSESVLATDGTIDKFTGDGLMAFWGAPRHQPDHAERALKAVPQILMRVREFNSRREAQGEPPLEVGIGVNTGLAMVGNVGHRDRLNYTAVGDTVNTASRLESATKQLDCPLLVSEATFLRLPISVQRQLVRLSSIPIQGRRDRVLLYTLLSLARYRMTLTPKDGGADAAAG